MAYVGILTPRLEVIGAWSGLPPEIELSRAMSRDGSFTELVVGEDAPQMVSDTSASDLDPSIMLRCRALEVGAFLTVPIRIDSEARGALVLLAHTSRDFEPALVEWLERMSERISTVLTGWVTNAARRISHPGDAEDTVERISALAARIELALVELAPLVELARTARYDQWRHQRSATSLRQALANLGPAEDAYEDARKDLQRLLHAASELVLKRDLAESQS